MDEVKQVLISKGYHFYQADYGSIAEGGTDEDKAAAEALRHEFSVALWRWPWVYP